MTLPEPLDPEATDPDQPAGPPQHHPTLMSTGRDGCWCTCLCGWTSDLWTTTTGAHLAFGQHLQEAR